MRLLESQVDQIDLLSEGLTGNLATKSPDKKKVATLQKMHWCDVEHPAVRWIKQWLCDTVAKRWDGTKTEEIPGSDCVTS